MDRLKITEDIIERIVYGMENQKVPLKLDLSDGTLRTGTDEHLISLPPWKPADGYRLMDSFTASLPDCEIRWKLKTALQAGGGVFRRFKNTLKEQPETEILWLNYKKKSMRKIVISWLNRWSEALKMEELGEEPEDFADLPKAEFLLRPGVFDDELKIRKINSGTDDSSFPFFQELLPEFCELTVAETPAGDIAGFSKIYNSSEHFQLIQIYIRSGYCDTGIEQMLTENAVNQAGKSGKKSIYLQTFGTQMNDFFKQYDFTPLIIWHKDSR